MRKSILLFSAILSFAAIGRSEITIDYPQPVNSDPRRIELPFKADTVPDIQWQFSQDGGERWRPLLDKIGTAVTFAQPGEYWNYQTQLQFPGEFPAGMSFRVRFTTGPEQHQLSGEITLPHITPFPDQERVLNDVDFIRFEVDGGLIVGQRSVESGKYEYTTYQKTGSGWVESTTIQIPEGYPEESGFGDIFIVKDYQLFLTHYTDVGLNKTDGRILVYDWQGTATGWVLSQTIDATDLPQKEDGTFAANITLQEGYLMIGYSGGYIQNPGGAVYVYQKDPSGLWVFDQRLRAVSEKPFLAPYMKPLYIDGVIMIHGALREGYDNTFYFQKDGDGIWQCTLAEELPFREIFKVGNRLLRTSLYSNINDPDIGEGNTAFYVYSMEMNPGPTLLSTTIQKFGFFPSDVVDDWLVFAFEPSPDLALPGMGVALSPVYEDQIHPQPAILLPGEDAPLYTAVHSQDADGQRIYVTSFMNDGTKVMDSFDLSKVPHPRYPDVPFAKWSLVGFLHTPEILPIRYREDSSGLYTTRVMYSFDRLIWIEMLPNDFTKTVIDDNPDGDNRTLLVEILVPSEIDGKPVFYQLREDKGLPGP